MAIFAAVILRRRPSNDRDWSLDQKILATAVIRGDRVEIRNVRNFRYGSETDFAPAYETRMYHLQRLDSVWFVVERFGGAGIAHTFLSFGFGGDYLAISIEIRKEKGEVFSPLKGLLREFELMYVIGDERDLIGLRTNYRRDVVYLYPVRTTRDRMRRVFIDMLERANGLAARPEFYNTLTNNCTTNIARHVNTISPRRIPLSFKVLLPAYSDSLAYDLGLIDTNQSLEETRRAHRIDLLAQRLGVDEEFSRNLRRCDQSRDAICQMMKKKRMKPATTIQNRTKVDHTPRAKSRVSEGTAARSPVNAVARICFDNSVSSSRSCLASGSGLPMRHDLRRISTSLSGPK